MSVPAMAPATGTGEPFRGVKWHDYLFVVLAFAGIVAAGCLRIYEVLLEVLMVTMFLLSQRIVLGDDPANPLTRPRFVPEWVFGRLIAKRNALRSVLLGHQPGTAIRGVILSSIAVGCALTLLSIFWTPWQVVMAREVIEIALDLWIFIPAFFLLRLHYQAFVSDWKRTETEEAQEIAHEKRVEEALKEEAEAVGEENSEEGHSSLLSPDFGRGLLTMGKRLEAALAIGEIIRDYRGNGEAWRQDRDVEEAAERSARWQRAKDALYRMRLQTQLLFCGVPFALGWLVSMQFSLDAPRQLAGAVSRLIAG